MDCGLASNRKDLNGDAMILGDVGEGEIFKLRLSGQRKGFQTMWGAGAEGKCFLATRDSTWGVRDLGFYLQAREKGPSHPGHLPAGHTHTSKNTRTVPPGNRRDE